MESRSTKRLFDLFDSFGPIRETFYDYLDTRTAALVSLLPQGYKQLSDYISDEEKLSQLVGAGLQNELIEFRDVINQSVNNEISRRNAQVKKSWSPFKLSVPPRIVAVGTLGVTLWQSSYRWIRHKLPCRFFTNPNKPIMAKIDVRSEFKEADEHFEEEDKNSISMALLPTNKS